jgi:hypothetical protein
MRTMFPFNVLVRSRPIACLIRCPFYYIKERLSGCRPQIRLRIGHERKRSSAASAIGKCTTDQSLKPENRSSANRPQSVRTPAKQLRLGAEMAETFLWDWCGPNLRGGCPSGPPSISFGDFFLGRRNSAPRHRSRAAQFAAKRAHRTSARPEVSKTQLPSDGALAWPKRQGGGNRHWGLSLPDPQRLFFQGRGWSDHALRRVLK